MRLLSHLLLVLLLVVVVLSVAPCSAQGHHWEEKKEGNTVYCQVFDIETRDGFLGFGKSWTAFKMRYWLNRDGIDNYSEMYFSCSSYSSSSIIMDGQYFKCKTESKNHTNPDYRLKTSKYDFYVYVEDMHTNQYGVCWQGNKVSNLDIYWLH